MLVLWTEGGLEVRIIAKTGEFDVTDDERDGGHEETGDDEYGEEKDEGVGERKLDQDLHPYEVTDMD